MRFVPRYLTAGLLGVASNPGNLNTLLAERARIVSCKLPAEIRRLLSTTEKSTFVRGLKHERFRQGLKSVVGVVGPKGALMLVGQSRVTCFLVHWQSQRCTTKTSFCVWGQEYRRAHARGRQQRKSALELSGSLDTACSAKTFLREPWRIMIRRQLERCAVSFDLDNFAFFNTPKTSDFLALWESFTRRERREPHIEGHPVYPTDEPHSLVVTAI